MKKILLTLPIIAFAFLAVFCTKENTPTVPADVLASKNPDSGVSDRGDKEGEGCTVTIQSTGDITICGLANNTNTCTSCYGQSLVGEDSGSGTFVYNVVPVYPSMPFAIKNTSNQTVFVTISTSAIPPATWAIPAGECYAYAVAVTCYLFADRAPL